MAHSNPLTSDKIILFGDSLTEQSWNQEFAFNLAPALQHEYCRKLQVLTHGYGGYNSEHARHILDPMLDAEMGGGSRIRLLVIFFGTNDAVEAGNSRQHVPLARYGENLRFLVKRALSRGIDVILVGPAIVGDDAADRSSEINQQYSEAAKKVAAEQKLAFVDLWTAFKEYAISSASSGGHHQPNLLTSDGVHFACQAYRIWYELLLRTIRQSYPALRTEKLPTVLPHIFDIDPGDLPQSLWRK